MAAIDLENTTVPRVEQRQEPVQRLGPRAGTEGVGSEEIVSCTYLSVTLPLPPMTYKGYTVRRVMDPKKWDYRPEEDCKRDWDELER